MTEAWHYTTKEQKCGYGDERDDKGVGSTLTVDVEPEPCNAGLHGSEKLLDAIRFARSSMLRRVQLGGDMATQSDKIAATERTILAEPEPCEDTGASALEIAEYAHRTFARLAAAEALQFWDDPPGVVLEWLSTGDPELRDATRDAAGDAAWDAARDAARDARDAARDARDAGDAAWAAAGAARAAGAAARATRDAAMDDLNRLAEDVIPAIMGWDLDAIHGGSR